MSRAVTLDSKDARKRLQSQTVHWQRVNKGVALGYRKGVNRSEWYTRRFLDGKYHFDTIGMADDTRPADGKTVLTFGDALRRALDPDAGATEARRPEGLTVAEAATRYFTARDSKSRSAGSVTADQGKYRKHILAALGDANINTLTPERLGAWRDGLVAKALKQYDEAVAADNEDSDEPKPDAGERREAHRAAQANANRVWTVMRAILNHAYKNQLTPSDTAWRIVKPYRNVDKPRDRFLSIAESRRFLNACDSDFRPLARAALLTGLRQGELLSLTAADYRNGRIYVREAKSGKGRSVPLSAEGVQFFDSLTAGLEGSTALFRRPDGHDWRRIELSRKMLAAVKQAKITPAVTFHDLRRTYGSLLINAGTDADIIKELLGHADLRMTTRAYAHLLDHTVAKAVKAKLPKFGLDKTNVVPITRKRKGK